MAQAATPTITKTAEEILSPPARSFVADGKTFKIYPLPDGVLMTVADSLGEIIGLLRAAFKFGDDNDVKMNIAEALPVIPMIVKTLLPHSTRLISAALRVDESWVQDNLRLADRLRALRCIVLAEDVASLLGEWKALTEAVTPPAPKTTQSIA
jgi:hypothetical protein